MSRARTVLVLHDPASPPADLDEVAAGLRSEGARVVLRALEAPFDEVIAAIAAADVVLHWR